MILDKIRQLYPHLTKSQKRLADYIATSYQEAAFMTASRLAHDLSVNEATVIRFAQRLGYSGYPGLIQDIQALVRDELKTRAETETTETVPLIKCLNDRIEDLERTISHIPSELAQEMVVVLSNARRIVVIGEGLSSSLASLFCRALELIGLNVISPAADPANLALVLADVGGGDAIVGISTVFESPLVANALRYASQRGARTLALTMSPVSPCAQAAELAISAPHSEQLDLPSFAICATVIDALVQSMGAARPDVVRQRLEDIPIAREYILGRRRR